LAETPERTEARARPTAQVRAQEPAEAAPAAPMPAEPEPEPAAAEPAPSAPRVPSEPVQSPQASAGGIAAAEATPAAASAAAPSSETGGARPDAVYLLDAAIERNLVYPPIARKRGLQGRVELDIAVTEVGTLERCDLARSSGSSILDNAALRLLRGLFPFSGELGGAFAARIAIEYRLD
jgi:protein TonB